MVRISSYIIVNNFVSLSVPPKIQFMTPYYDQNLKFVSLNPNIREGMLKKRIVKTNKSDKMSSLDTQDLMVKVNYK